MGVIEMGWWGTIESAHGLMEGVKEWESYYFILRSALLELWSTLQ